MNVVFKIKALAMPGLTKDIVLGLQFLKEIDAKIKLRKELKTKWARARNS